MVGKVQGVLMANAVYICNSDHIHILTGEEARKWGGVGSRQMISLSNGTVSSSSSSDAPLLLMDEEALFMCMNDTLEVKYNDTTLRMAAVSELFHLFCRKCPEFTANYCTYKFFRDEGYVVKSGLNFGVHYAVYHNLPSQCHSEMCVTVVDSRDPSVTTGGTHSTSCCDMSTMSWRHVSTLTRVIPDVMKLCIICYVHSTTAGSRSSNNSYNAIVSKKRRMSLQSEQQQQQQQGQPVRESKESPYLRQLFPHLHTDSHHASTFESNSLSTGNATNPLQTSSSSSSSSNATPTTTIISNTNTANTLAPVPIMSRDQLHWMLNHDLKVLPVAVQSRRLPAPAKLNLSIREWQQRYKSTSTKKTIINKKARNNGGIRHKSATNAYNNNKKNEIVNNNRNECSSSKGASDHNKSITPAAGDEEAYSPADTLSAAAAASATAVASPVSDFSQTVGDPSTEVIIETTATGGGGGGGGGTAAPISSKSSSPVKPQNINKSQKSKPYKSHKTHKQRRDHTEVRRKTLSQKNQFWRRLAVGPSNDTSSRDTSITRHNENMHVEDDTTCTTSEITKRYDYMNKSLGNNADLVNKLRTPAAGEGNIEVQATATTSSATSSSSNSSSISNCCIQ